MTAKQPEVLFHYTTEAGLHGILGSQTIWATHHAFTNDASEMQRALGALSRAIMPDIQDVYIRRRKAGEITLKPEHKNLSPEEVARREAETFINVVWTAANDLIPCYITSFCGAPEQDNYTLRNGLLSQWRAYGGSGYAIEFDYKGLCDALQSDQERCTHSGYEVSAVHYVMDPGADLPFQDEVDKVRNLVHKIFEDFEGAEEEIRELHLPIMRCMALTKDWAFHEEREVRVFHFRPNDEGVPEGRARPRTIHFADRGVRVPHICLFDHSDIKLPIRRVIIGPGRDNELRMQSLELFRKDRGLEFDIHVSEIPLLDR